MDDDRTETLTRPAPAAETSPSRPEQGHWLLARLGKRVLRPGGLGLTRWLLDRLAIGAGDHVVEFGPGVGRTAELLWAAKPQGYIGVEPSPMARETLAAIVPAGQDAQIRDADATASGLDGSVATVVVGEALLTMQSPQRKAAMVAEAYRLLAPGGRYGIHEMSLQPEDLDDAGRQRVVEGLSRSIKVGAQPLTVPAWRQLLEDEGFEILEVTTAPMALLEPARLVQDEGIAGAARFLFNVARDRDARRRVLEMRASFRAHRDQLGAVAIVARRPLTTEAAR
jgi:hypothetical protein